MACFFGLLGDLRKYHPAFLCCFRSRMVGALRSASVGTTRLQGPYWLDTASYWALEVVLIVVR